MLTWEKDLAVALEKAASGKKIVLIDFYNPQ